MALPRFLKPSRGSVLVFSLLVLAILLSTAITVATVSITNKRTVGDSLQTNRSFQIASSGTELTLEQIYKETAGTLNALATAMGGGDATCQNGVITHDNILQGEVRMSFFDNSGNQLACNDANWRTKVVRLKAEGSIANTIRVIETAVAAGAGVGWVNIHGEAADNGSIVLDGGSGGDRYYVYPSGTHNLTQVCVDGGFAYPTGACRVRDVGANPDHDVIGSASSFYNRSTKATAVTCSYWHGRSYADETMQILCAR